MPGPTVGDISELCRELRSLGALEIHFGIAPDGSSKIEVRFGAPAITIRMPNGETVPAPAEDSKAGDDSDLYDAVP
jgi:hypothetical protein